YCFLHCFCCFIVYLVFFFMLFLFLFFFFYCYCHPRDLHSFPTRRSSDLLRHHQGHCMGDRLKMRQRAMLLGMVVVCGLVLSSCRSEEHTSELQSLRHLVCRLLLEKKKKKKHKHNHVNNTTSLLVRADTI